MQVICILPSLFISLPKPVWAKFGGWSEGGLVAIATSTAFLPSRRRRPQDSEQSHFAQTSAFESQPGAPQHSWVTLLFSPPLWQQRDVGEEEPPPVPHRQEEMAAKLGMGSIPKKILPLPSWTRPLIRRLLLSSWRTYLACWRRTQGIVHRYLEPFGTLYLPGAGRYDLALWGGQECQGGCATCQMALNTQVWGDDPFFWPFLLHLPNQYNRLSTALTPPHPKTWGFISFYTMEGAGPVRRNRLSRSCITQTPFVSRLLWIVCNYVWRCMP